MRFPEEPEDFGIDAGKEAMRVLAESREMLTRYSEELERAGTAHRVIQLCAEATTRLKQLENLIGKILPLLEEACASHPPRLVYPEDTPIEDIEDAFKDLMERYPPMDAKRRWEIGDDVILFTESFYWIAGRVRTVVRLLPRLGSFEAQGVRNVRNKLLEHPEKKDSGVLIVSFAWGGPRGATVKGIREEGQVDVFPDAGLFPNAHAFGLELSSKVKAAIETL